MKSKKDLKNYITYRIGQLRNEYIRLNSTAYISKDERIAFLKYSFVREELERLYKQFIDD